jgi:phosphoglycerate dehydrogenase-like enzyme
MKILIGPNQMQIEKALPEMQQKYPDVDFDVCTDREDVINHIGDADGYIGFLNTETFQAAKQLKWIQSPASGVNYFLDVDGLKESDVVLCSAAGTHGGSVAESAIAMMLAFTRGIRASVQDQPEHKWGMREIRSHNIELSGTTAGLVGFGQIGRALAQRLAGFEMRIIAVDLFPKDKPDYVDELWGMDRLDDLLAQSDFVFTLVPYTADTVDMIGEEELSKMKPTAMLVGMSRGGIINEDALINALKDGTIAYAACDVFAIEPLPEDSELWDLPNMLVAAHIAGGTQREYDRIMPIVWENLDNFVNGRTPTRNQVDKTRGF